MKKILVAIIFLGLTAGIQAAPILDFNMDAAHPAGAKIIYSSVGLVGSDISVDSIIGLDTPANGSSLISIQNGILSFSYVSGGASSIQIVGGISALQIPDGTVLMQGEISSFEVIVLPNNNRILAASFSDDKDAALAAYFGLKSGEEHPWAGSMNLAFAVNGGGSATNRSLEPLPDSEESSRVLSGDIFNSPIPEPMTILLVGTGLVGLGLARRKKA